MVAIKQRDIDSGLLMHVEYSGNDSVVLRGGLTGRQYSFSARQRSADVDPRDMSSLLQDTRFRLKGLSQKDSGA